MGVLWILKKNNANSPRKKQTKGCGLACWKLRFESYWNNGGGVKAGSIYRETFKRRTIEGIKTFQQANLRNSWTTIM